MLSARLRNNWGLIPIVAAWFAGCAALAPALWLDEAQSVSFARLPFGSIPSALRTDGAPPLYYLILHGWIRLFGDGDFAGRALSCVFAAGFVVALGALARRLAGTSAGWVAMVLAATNPFVIRYATETRMYALVMLEVTLAALAITTALHRPTLPALTGTALATAALMYTHYWGLYAVAATGLVLAWRAVRRDDARPVVAAMVVGGVLWLPWLGNFRFQSQRTGTPWRGAPTVREALQALIFPRGTTVPLVILGVVLLVAAVVGVIRRGAVRPLAIVYVCGAAIAFVGASASASAFVPRYTAAFAPLLLACAAVGIATSVPRRGILAVALSGLGVMGMILGISAVRTERTRAPRIVAALEQQASDGDVVMYCPDQLGPAVARLLQRSDVDLAQLPFPIDSLPERVDWIDYAERYAAARPALEARALDRMAGTHTVWLVWSDVYPPTGPVCQELLSALGQLRTEAVVVAHDPRAADHDALIRFDP